MAWQLRLNCPHKRPSMSAPRVTTGVLQTAAMHDGNCSIHSVHNEKDPMVGLCSTHNRTLKCTRETQFPMYLTTLALRHGGVWESGRIDPRFLGLGTRTLMWRSYLEDLRKYDKKRQHYPWVKSFRYIPAIATESFLLVLLSLCITT
jgi:hypothetical protein